MLARILETEAAAELSDDTRRTIKWVLGEGQASAVKGLSACINEVEGERRAAAEEAAEKRKEKLAAKAKKKAPTNAAKPKDGEAPKKRGRKPKAA